MSGQRVARLAVLPLTRRSGVLLVAASMFGIVGLAWPLFAPASAASPDIAHAADAPWLFAVLLPLLLAIVVAEIGEGALDAKAVAVLGVLVACGAVLRLPSGGLTGFTFLFVLLIPAGRVFGPGFGFVLGALTLFASALITGGVGPWLPFQMLGAAWVGFFAGCLPAARGRAEVVLLATYGVVAGFGYGIVLDLWFWPFGAGTSDLAFHPGAPVVDNLRRFWAFHLATSLGFDVPRAVGNAVLVGAAGGPLLAALRRTSRRAVFGAQPYFLAEDPVTAEREPTVEARTMQQAMAPSTGVVGR